MVTISGALVEVGSLFIRFDPTGSVVVVKQGDKVVEAGVVDSSGNFEVAIPDGIKGELALVVGIPGAVPVLFEADDGDMAFHVIVNRSGDNVM